MMFLPGTLIAHYLPEILLSNQNSIIHRQIPNAQVVNTIVSIKITPELFHIFLMSLSKEY